jgi:TctA family transporter
MAPIDATAPKGNPLLPLFYSWGKKLGRLAAWAWTIIAGGGGLGLLITRGPLPLTNGWFALFSGISACPLTAWLLKKYAGITLSGWARFAIAFLIIVAGRLVLKRHIPD